MNRAARGALAAAIGFAGAFVVGSAAELGSETRPGASTVLGDLDLPRYCRERYGIDSAATLISADAAGWRCAGRRNGVWGIDEIDFFEACRAQFGPRAAAQSWDPSVPASWQCVNSP